ncbi:MAG TPA: hypothetical protein VHQ68_11405, partial [Propionibacteriaceae bacterium]|nr:hypothetical protein [Propionibacteriaceae bacterium]
MNDTPRKCLGFKTPAGGVRRRARLNRSAPNSCRTSTGTRHLACRPGFFLPVRVLSRLFRRLFLEGLGAAHGKGEIKAF